MSNEMPTNDEELLRQQQIAESQEWRETQEIVSDIGTYIKLHKEVLLGQKDPEMNMTLKQIDPSWYFGNQDKKLTELVKSSAYWGPNHHINNKVQDLFERYGEGAKLYFVDKENNIAEVNIDPKKIVKYNGLMENKPKLNEKLNEDIKNLGFTDGRELDNPDNFSTLARFLDIAFKIKIQRLEKEAKES